MCTPQLEYLVPCGFVCRGYEGMVAVEVDGLIALVGQTPSSSLHAKAQFSLLEEFGACANPRG